MKRNILALVAVLVGTGLLLSAAASAQTGPPGTVASWFIPFVKGTNDPCCGIGDTVSNTHITLTYNAGIPPSPFAPACATAVFFYNKNGSLACGVPMPLAPNNSRTVCSGSPNPDVSSSETRKAPTNGFVLRGTS